MTHYKRLFLVFITFCFIGCGKNNETKKPQVNQGEEPSIDNINSVTQQKDSFFETPEDSIMAIKESVLRKQNSRYRKKKQTMTPDDKIVELSETKVIPNKPTSKKTAVPSFIYIKKILNECKVGVPMTQKDLETNYNIPKEGIQLVKSVTKISENELDVKWKSTWLIEKMSDAKFKDGRLKVRFDKNKMYTSGGAIAIKYEKKLYTDLYLIGRAAYIPTVRGYYWQIGKD